MSVERELIGLERLRERMAGQDKTCFVEREAVLDELDVKLAGLGLGEGTCVAFEALMDRCSTSIEDDDVFLGRMVEGPVRVKGPEERPTRQVDPFARCGWMTGHMTLDRQALVERGLSAIVAEAIATATQTADPVAIRFAERLTRVVAAIGRFAQRYAVAARRRAAGHADPAVRGRLERAAAALDHVPLAPANDFFAALQSIWLLHLIYSAMVGGRDFAFGRLDQVLWSFYQRGLASGLSRADAIELLAHFCMKTNEIIGTGSVFNAGCWPIPCTVSKQYLLLGGSGPSGAPAHQDLSQAFLEAARRVRLGEPSIVVRWHPDGDGVWKDVVSEAVLGAQGQVQIVNEAVAIPTVIPACTCASPASASSLCACIPMYRRKS